MFWWQACGQGLNKAGKPLISMNFPVATHYQASYLARIAELNPQAHGCGYPHFLVASLWKNTGKASQVLEWKRNLAI